MISINIIGAGNLGKSLARLLIQTGMIRVQGVCNASLESATRAVSFIQQGTPYTLSELPPAEITFITTPDDLIEKICNDYHNHIIPGSIVLHCSGCLTSDVLYSVKNKAYVASIHPMKSFKDPVNVPDEYSETICAMEGDPEALSKLQPIFSAIDFRVFLIQKDKKALYHTAGVFASNYMVTLFNEALSCLQMANVENELIPDIIISLMKGTLNNLESTRSAKEALTGPVQRDDITTIKRNIDSLSTHDQKKLYSILANSTLKLTSHNNSKIQNILSEFL